MPPLTDHLLSSAGTCLTTLPRKILLQEFPSRELFLQVWLLCVLVGIARGSTALRLAIAGGCAVLSILALEGRLWRPQLFRLGLVSALVFVFTALLAGKAPCLAGLSMSALLFSSVPSLAVSVPSLDTVLQSSTLLALVQTKEPHMDRWSDEDQSN